MITLTGKITSGTINYGTISNSVSITSTADIVNTSNSNSETSFAISNSSTGALTISGGTVSATSGYAVCNNTGTVSISGGTVSATSGYAVYDQSFGTGGKITVSGTTKVISASPFATIAVMTSIYGNTKLEMTGGTVENTGTGTAMSLPRLSISGGTVSATSGYAVTASDSYAYVYITVSGTAKVTSATTTKSTIYLRYNETDTALNITGGTVENTGSGKAIENDSKCAISITGGTVSAPLGYAVYNRGTGKVTIGPGATIVGNNYGIQ